MNEYYRRHLEDRAIHRRWMDPRLVSLRLVDIEGYLDQKGWKRITSDEPNLVVYQEPHSKEQEPLYQWLPQSEQQRDYLQRVYELLAAIAESEDRYAGDVLTEMLHAPSSGDGVGTNALVGSALK